MFTRRTFLKVAAAAPMASAQSRLRPARHRPTNFLVILTDDLGFGDVGFTGSKIKTPNLDRLAGAGAQLNQFYAGNPVCSPSRAAFLTAGRYPTRMGIPSIIFFPPTFLRPARLGNHDRADAQTPRIYKRVYREVAPRVASGVYADEPRLRLVLWRAL